MDELSARVRQLMADTYDAHAKVSLPKVTASVGANGEA
jgi:hypothetical protein